MVKSEIKSERLETWVVEEDDPTWEKKNPPSLILAGLTGFLCRQTCFE